MISTPTTTRTAKSSPLSSSNIRYGVVANISRSHNLREKVPRSPGFDSLYRIRLVFLSCSLTILVISTGRYLPFAYSYPAQSQSMVARAWDKYLKTTLLATISVDIVSNSNH
ncbi:hypothetical protein CEP51_010897 [Fusarium floridanum]|uniref:Uncharacterized protein n=1 Tax=Fusarium floridanum TaxID=1325733 RepID=A0A428RCY7_9HYPO|nr:hypothetical protein CEP51_010897 [Fusarium floridanum]